MVEALDKVQPGLFRVVGKQTGPNEQIEHLRAFVKLTGYPVLHQVFAFQLLHCRVTERHVAAVIHKRFHLVKFSFGVIPEQMLVIFFFFHQFDHVAVQSRRLKLAKRFLAQVENSQTGSQILVVWRLGGNQISGGFDQRFVNIGGLDAIVKLNMGF